MAEPNGYIQGTNGVPIEMVDSKARQELTKKLTRPATAQVGDYLRIKAIGADGTIEVEAVPAPSGGATVPTKVSAFENDAGYATEARVQELLAEFPTFQIEVVQELPAAGEEKTIYLVPFADDSGSYLEYLYVNGAWEVVGNGKDSGQYVNLTAAQVNALDGMFRVCAYVKGDVSPEYNAFRVAFGLDGSGGDSGGDEDMPGNNNTVLLSNVDTANPGEINIEIIKKAMPSLLAYGFNVETKETGLGGKHITGITVKCKTAGTITIGKVDMSNYKAGVAPVMIGEKAFEIAAGMNELDVDFALSETETIGFQISTDTGAVAFGLDDDEIVDEMCIMPADQYRDGIKDRLRLYGSIYGGDI